MSDHPINLENSSTKDKAQGKLHEAAGSIKETIGHAVGNEKLEAKGAQEKFDGQVQHKVGEVKAVVGK